MLAATWLTACGTLATVPVLRPMRLAPSDAKALGDAWASYIESFPSAKRRATLQMVQRIVPGLIAFGATALIFAPRLQQVSALAKVMSEGQPRPTTQPPQSFRNTFGNGSQRPQEGPIEPPNAQARNDILDAMDGGDG